MRPKLIMSLTGERSQPLPPKVRFRAPTSLVQLTPLTTSGTNFSTLFPGIRPHLLTLASNFKIPLYRDLILSLGISSVSKKSCTNILRQGPGSAITIVVGGAAESLAAHPGTNDLTLRKRLGFIKIAVKEGWVAGAGWVG